MAISEVFNMDCMEGMKQYPDKYFDLAIVDPPYGLDDMKKNINGRHRDKLTTYTNKHIPNFEYFMEVRRVSKRSIIWGCQYYIHFMQPDGSFIVWDKMKDPDTCNMSSCDIAWYSKRERVRTFKGVWNGALKIGNEKTIHPHQKPVSLYKWLLKNYCDSIRDKILDTHLGSGSSRIAANEMGFDFTGYEIDKYHFEAQEKRFNEYKSQLKMFAA